MNPADYQVSTDRDRLNMPWLLASLQGTKWGKYYTMPALLKSCDHSTCFGLYRGKIQVGFARVISDMALTSTLNDVYIEKVLRGVGLGTLLMRAVIAHHSVFETLNIIGTDDAQDFYPRFGYEPLDRRTTVFTRQPG